MGCRDLGAGCSLRQGTLERGSGNLETWRAGGVQHRPQSWRPRALLQPFRPGTLSAGGCRARPAAALPCRGKPPWSRAECSPGPGAVQAFTQVLAGLGAVLLGLKVVLVAATAAVDELLAGPAGGVVEEADEERLAAAAHRGQVAEVWGRGGQVGRQAGGARKQSLSSALASRILVPPPAPSLLRRAPSAQPPSPRDPGLPAAKPQEPTARFS